MFSYSYSKTVLNWPLPLLLLLALCLQRPLGAEQVKVGVSLPLTGSTASIGNDSLKVLRFAADRLGAGRYKLVVQDDRCSGKDAVSAAHHLIEVEKVQFVVGLPCSGSLMAAAPIYSAARVVVISSAASSPKISGISPYVFRTWPSDADGIALLSSYIAERHKRVGMISEETDYAQDFAKLMRKLLQGRQVEVLEENFLPEDTDFRLQLLKLGRQRIDALIINPQNPEKSILLVRQIQQLRQSIPLYANVFPGSGVFRQAFRDELPAITYTDLKDIGRLLSADFEGLYQEYTAAFGELQSVAALFVSNYNALWALDQALRVEAPVVEVFRKQEFKGLHGLFSFDAHGDTSWGVYELKQLAGGL